MSSRNQSTMSSSEKLPNQPDQELLNMINDWKTKTRVGKFDRIKKMVFSFNQRPTDFKPADFFPPIPDSEIASDSEEKTIDKIDKERKSLSKRKLDYENLVEIEELIDNQAESEKLNGSSLNENEKHRRQPHSNEHTNLGPFSPINSPTLTNRNVIKLNRESLLKQLDKDKNIQSINEISNENNKESNLSFAQKNSISELSNQVSLTKNFSNTHEEPVDSNEKCNISVKESIRTPKIKSKSHIETEEDKENFNQISSKNEESNIFEPPTPPQVQQVQSEKHLVPISPNQLTTRSSITITKRKSAEPVRDIQVDLSTISTKPKILTKQKTASKINESINDSQTELLTSQSNTYIRRKSTLNNKTSNLTVNSSASVLFKPAKSKKTKELNNLPPAPLFTRENNKNSSEHETSSDNNSFEKKQKRVRSKKSTKNKQKQQQIENVSKKQQDDTSSSNKQSQECKIVTNDLESDQIINEYNKASENDDNIAIDKNVSIEKIDKSQKSVENKKNSSVTKKDSKENDVKSDDKIDHQTTPLIKTKKNIKQKNKKEDSSKEPKNSKTRQPLKNIQNQKQIAPKTRTSSQKEIGYFINNKTVPYEQKMIDECENDGPLALRRSKRAKIDKHSQPIYGYEEINDYKGNKCIVRKVIGTKDKIDIKINKELMRINHYLTDNIINKPKEKKKKRVNKNIDKTQLKISDAFKKIDKTQQMLEMNETNKKIDDYLINHSIDQSNIIEPNRLETGIDLVLPNNPVDEQQENVNNQLELEKNSSHVENSALNIEESLSISADSNVNDSMEFIFSKKDGTSIPIHIYFFHKNIEKKSFQHYSNGVQISPISDMTGILRINGLSSTKTNYHNFAVNYFVQNGSFLFSLNGILSIHHEKDVIYIPKSNFFLIIKIDNLIIFFCLRYSI